MRAILISLLLMTAPAAASDHAIAILHPHNAKIEGYPNDNEIHIGARFVGTAHVKRWLTGFIDVSEIEFDLDIPDARPLGDFYAIVDKDQYGHLDIWDISAVTSGFCLDAKDATDLAESIARLKRRFPCVRK